MPKIHKLSFSYTKNKFLIMPQSEKIFLATENLSLVLTTPEEFENGGFTLKTHQMFSVHTTPEEFKNATITGHFGFVFEENLSREIT